MKIVDIKTAVVAYHGKATLIRIDTDVGISGFGEANPDAGAAAIVGLISELKSELVGEDPRNVEYCWEKLRRKHVFSGAQSGIFLIALSGSKWRSGISRPSPPVSRSTACSVGSSETASASTLTVATATALGVPGGLRRRARRMVEEGFTALKFDIDELGHPAKFDTANHTINGAEFAPWWSVWPPFAMPSAPTSICVSTFTPGMTFRAPVVSPARWSDFNLLWLEEPIPAENVEALKQIRMRSKTPICVGENLYLRWGFRELIQQQCADVVMPDVPNAEGCPRAGRSRISQRSTIYLSRRISCPPRLDHGDLPCLRIGAEFPRSRVARP